MTVFRWVSWRNATPLRLTSLPVPAVVGMAMSGGSGWTTKRSPPVASSYWLSGGAWLVSSWTSFAASSGLPPPRAMMPSQPPVRYASSPAKTSRSVGSGVTRSKRTWTRPASPRIEITRSTSPALTTPASVITSGRCSPSRRTSSGRRRSAAAPSSTRVGQENTVMRSVVGRSKKGVSMGQASSK